MNAEIKNRLFNLRASMKQHGLSAYLINGSDPHMSEYVPERWKTREYISGFSGSYGWLAIGIDNAVLWTDSRYYLQAEEQLRDTGIQMLKARLPETPSVSQWLANELKEGDVVGFDGACYSMAEILTLSNELKKCKVSLNPSIDLLEEIWSSRPELPSNKAFLHPLKRAGVGRKEKIDQVKLAMTSSNADTTVIAALDDLCWTFNLRGADVECNPVVLGFAIINKNNTKLFIDKGKFADDQLAEISNDGIDVYPYNQFYAALEELENCSVLLDPSRTNSLIYDKLKDGNIIISQLSVPALLKSVKNEVELEGMTKAHITDALALLDFQLWLEDSINNGVVSEWDVAVKLQELRQSRHGYVGASFFPIVGYKDHGAIVHFRVTQESAKTLEKEGILLIDSGGQYENGTTDITRTIALGPVTPKMKKDFTLVLKGMIALSMAQFPKGTHGCHLDVLARSFLWREAQNYGHGTGHGVGAFLNVHEGPISIRPDLNAQVLQAGNVLSNEPGCYREGEYGIRIENLIYCVEGETSEFGEFLKFKTLTCYPIDTSLIDSSLLLPEEKDWLNAYHESIIGRLGHLTNTEQFQLLKRLTKAI